MSEKKTTVTGDAGGGRQVSIPVELPGNTNKAKAVPPVSTARKYANKPAATREVPKEEREKLTQVTAKPGVKKKPSFGSRIKETFTGEDARSVGQYLFFDVVVPNIKTLIADMASQGTERLLFGSTSSRSAPRNDRERNHVPYSRISTSRSNTRDLSRDDRTNHRFDNIFVDTRSEADEILGSLTDSAERYGYARVNDLYDLVGITGEFTDENWGWDPAAMRRSGFRQSREGYILLLPRPDIIE